MKWIQCTCGKLLQLSEEKLLALQGRKITCPRCGKSKRVPELPPAEAPVPVMPETPLPTRRRGPSRGKLVVVLLFWMLGAWMAYWAVSSVPTGTVTLEVREVDHFPGREFVLRLGD